MATHSSNILVLVSYALVPRSPVLPAHIVEICYRRKKSESEVAVVSDSLRPPWTVAYQTPPSMGFSRQEYWSGLPFPSPGDLPNPGIEPRSLTFQAEAFFNF